MEAGIMTMPMKTQPMTERREKPSTKEVGGARRERYCSSSRSSFMRRPGPVLDVEDLIIYLIGRGGIEESEETAGKIVCGISTQQR